MYKIIKIFFAFQMQNTNYPSLVEKLKTSANKINKFEIFEF